MFGIKFIVQGRYQGVLYFQNVILCNGICENVILFTPIIKVRVSLRRISRYSQITNSIIFRPLVWNFSQIEQLMWEIAATVSTGRHPYRIFIGIGRGV
jgi:hypothetical protein